MPKRGDCRSHSFSFCPLSSFSLPISILLLLVFLGGTSAAAADTDFTGPSITVTSHQNGQIVNTKTIVLAGTATDAGRGGNGISSVYARGRTEGGTVTGNEIANWTQTITLNPGANYIEVTAYDASANQNSSSQQLTINFQPLDSLPPNISVTSHANGQTVNTKEITLTGTATDAGNGNNGISSVYLRGYIPGATTTGAGTATWSKTVELNPGANYIEIDAYDNSDVQNMKALALTINFQPVDPLGPNLSITSHTSGQTVATSSITLQGMATDAGRGNSGISSVYVRGYLPDTAVAGAGTVNWSRTVDLSPGANYLTVYAYDNSDVKNEAQQAITINFQPGDTLAPVLTVNSHTNGQTVFTSTITITGSATDAARGDHGISSVYLNGKIPDAVVQGGGVVNWSRTVELSPGRNSLTVYAYDNTEFPNQAAEALVINFQASDTLGPNLQVTSHFDGQTVNTKTVEIRGTASDAGRGNSGISSVYVNGKIPDSTAAGGDLLSWRQTVELSPGRNNINVTAYDNSQFPNATSLSFVLSFVPDDNLAPALQVTSHTDGQVVFTNVVTVSGTASDAGRGNDGISYVKVNFVRAEGDTAVGTGVANWSRTFGLSPGANTIYINAADASEFQWDTNVTLHLTYQVGDLTAPSVTIETPRNGATVSTSSITISGTATDSGTGNSGIAGLTLNGSAIAGVTANGSGTATWSQTVNLQRGANVIAVVARDNSGNAGTATITVNYEPVDLLGPTLTIESHRNNLTVTTGSITLSGTATDEGTGNSGIASVTVNGTRAASDTAAGSGIAHWSRSIDLVPGANVISVVARDDSANHNDTAQAITIMYDPSDTAAPEISITSHRKEQIVSTSTIILAGTATDAGHGNNGISSVLVNGEPATGGTAAGSGTANWSHQIDLQLGANVISVVAADNSAGKNSAAATINLIYEPVDRTPPDLEVTSHKTGQTVSSATIVLAGIATDADRGDNGVTSVTINGAVATGGSVAAAGQARWSAPLNLNLGENVISIVAADTKGNTAARTLVLTYDPRFVLSLGNFCWVSRAGSPGTDAGYSIALDAQGNSYVAGLFEGVATFGTSNLVSRGSSDIFVTKFNPEGQLLWVRQAGGPAADAAFGIAVSTNGNCYVTGYFSTRAAFGPVNVETTGTFDMFLAKYNLDGQLQWVTDTGKGAGLTGSSVALDAEENCYLAGSFAYDAFFGDVQLVNNEFYDGFLAKYDSEGNALWVTQLGGEGEDRTTGIAVDRGGRVYVTGYFADGAFFGDKDLQTAGVHDTFVAQYNSDGNLNWVQQAGAVEDTKSAGIAVDASGNAFVTGYYDSATAFGTNALATSGFFDLFLAKYDVQGKLLWVRNTQKSNGINGSAVGVDGDGNAYVAGSFVGPATVGLTSLTNTETSDLFVTKYDAEGNVLSVRTAVGDSAVSAYGIAVTSSGAVYLTGSSAGVAQFGDNTLLSNSTADLFAAKISDGVTAVAPFLGIQAIAPAHVQLQFQGETCSNYRLQASIDLKTWNTLLTTNGTPNATVQVEPRDGPYRFFRVISP